MTAGVAPPEAASRKLPAPSVLAVVVTHRGRTWLRDCLVALDSQVYGPLTVLVVDDASPDSHETPALKRIAKRHLRKRQWAYLRTPRPLGFGGAINWAMSRVRTEAQLFLFLHDDAALAPDALTRLVARLVLDDDTAIVGPKVVSWDDPQRLEEVGMAADRFGYPFKDIEDGEIDSGQHDKIAERFYVTSTCMLMRQEVFRSLGGWDVRLGAFAEDFDLCWRTRLAGYSVGVEPTARVRHAIAMASGKRATPFVPSRYYIRRNRFRTVFKNASLLRLVFLIPQFLLLTLAEMLGFIVLRQPGEIRALARGLGWNLLMLPQTLSERIKVQRSRQISDRELRRLTVKQSTRVRAYISSQRDRLEIAWGRRAQVIAEQASRLQNLRTRSRTGLIALGFVVLIALLLGFRNVWFGEQAAVGELLPYPDRATALLRAYLSPWRGVGLGQPGPQPVALALLGPFPLLTFGSAAAAQKLLLFSLGAMSFAGAYRLVADLVDRWGRLAAGSVYLLGAVGFAGIRQGALGALVFGAAAPWVLRGLIRLTGWTRPPDWNAGRTIGQTTLGIAVSAAFVPGAILAYALATTMLVVLRSLSVNEERTWRRSLGAYGSIAAGWVLLLPWSARWFLEGGPLALLTGDVTSAAYVTSFQGHGMLSTLLGQTPEGPVLLGVALPILGAVAIITGSGQRRRVAIALWGVVVVIGAWVAVTTTGVLRPLVASPTEAGVLAAVAFAGLAGLAVGAFKLDLPRRDYGLLRWTTLTGLAGALGLLLAGIGPAILDADWSAGRGSNRENSRIVDQVRSILRASSSEVGVFRALWVGDRWSSPIASTARPFEHAFVTGSRGQVLSDLFERRAGAAEDALNRVISSIEQGTTDRGGALLGAFNVDLIVVDAEHEQVRSWLGQRDLALLRTEPEYLLLEHKQFLSRAGVFSELPLYVKGVSAEDPGVTTGEPEVPLDSLGQQTSSLYRDSTVPRSGVVFLAEETDAGWTASLDGVELERTPGGWGNAFVLPGGAGQGALRVGYERPTAEVVWLIAAGLAWVVVLGAAFSRRRRHEVVL